MLEPHYVNFFIGTLIALIYGFYSYTEDTRRLHILFFEMCLIVIFWPLLISLINLTVGGTNGYNPPNGGQHTMNIEGVSIWTQ